MPVFGLVFALLLLLFTTTNGLVPSHPSSTAKTTPRLFASTEFTAEFSAEAHRQFLCPRRQLLGFVGHVGGGGSTGATVYARRNDRCNAPWFIVGRVAAGNVHAADDSAEAHLRAAFLQYQLICDHARKLMQGGHMQRRTRVYTSGQRATEDFQLGVLAAAGTKNDGTTIITPVAAPEEHSEEPSVEAMLSCGFLGDVPALSKSSAAADTSAQRRGGLYAQFLASNLDSEDSALRYDRRQVRARLEGLLGRAPCCSPGAAAGVDPTSSSPPPHLRRGSALDEHGQPRLAMLAWPQCGFASRARKLLQAHDVPFLDVPMEKYSPLHAELALLIGRPSVPAIFEDGFLLGGCEPSNDDGTPGLAGSSVLAAAMAEVSASQQQSERAQTVNFESRA